MVIIPNMMVFSEGDHTLELRSFNAGTQNNGTVYVDKFTVENGSSTASPAAGPGATSSSSEQSMLGQSLTKTLDVSTSTKEIAVAVESANGLPVRIVLIDPSGAVLKTANSVNGLATIETPVSMGGAFMLKVINISTGAVQISTMVTPLVQR